MQKRKCAYSKCDKYFELKNPKKRFCNINCKNKAAYLYKLKNYPWEIKQLKARRKNIQILEYMYDQNKTLLSLEDLMLLGFEITCAILPYKNTLGQPVYRYGNLLLTIITKNECQITKI